MNSPTAWSGRNDHLVHQFYETVGRLGAKLALLAVEQPGLFEEARKSQLDRTGQFHGIPRRRQWVGFVSALLAQQFAELLHLALATISEEAGAVLVPAVEMPTANPMALAAVSQPRDISYRVHVRADAPQAEIDGLIRSTDAVTEIQNTVRTGCAVKLIMGD
jgi:hypothetical protein